MDMTGQLLTGLLEHPEQTLLPGRAEWLEEFVNTYPYCQSAQILLAATYFLSGNVRYPAQLKMAAASAGDRRVLRELIMTVRASQASEETALSSPVLPAGPEELPEPVSFVPRVVRQDPAEEQRRQASQKRFTREELLSIVRRRLAEISDGSVEENPPAPALPETAGPGTPAPSGSGLNKADLIERFIREEPRITRTPGNTAGFADEPDPDRSDDGEIVSETLAGLYARQGNLSEAIRILEKLSLQHREKSRYFAAQIENLRSPGRTGERFSDKEF